LGYALLVAETKNGISKIQSGYAKLVAKAQNMIRFLSVAETQKVGYAILVAKTQNI